MRRSPLILFVALAGLSACDKPAPSADPTAPAASARGSAEDAVAALERSWGEGKADVAVGHYADDAVIFTTDRSAPSSDSNVNLKDTAAFMAMKPADFTVSERRLQKLGDNAAVSSGILSFTADVGDARPVLSARFTQVLHRAPDGQWKIVHEHMSLPPQGQPGQ